MLTFWLERIGYALGSLLLIAGAAWSWPASTENALAFFGGAMICWAYAVANARRLVQRAIAVGDKLSNWDWPSAVKLAMSVTLGSTFFVAGWTGENPLGPFGRWLRLFWGLVTSSVSVRR